MKDPPDPRERHHTHIIHPILFTHNRGPAMADSAEGSRGDHHEAVPSAANSSSDGAR